MRAFSYSDPQFQAKYPVHAIIRQQLHRCRGCGRRRRCTFRRCPLARAALSPITEIDPSPRPTNLPRRRRKPSTAWGLLRDFLLNSDRHCGLSSYREPHGRMAIGVHAGRTHRDVDGGGDGLSYRLRAVA